jgi:DNA-binding IclR family transcriptional regulator
MYLAAHPKGSTLSSVAAELDIIPSTCLHILWELVAAGLASYTSSGKLYRLGPTIFVLSSQLNRGDVFIQTAQPLLDQITRSLGVFTTASTLDENDHIIIVAAANAGKGVRFELGNRIPALASATGRCVAAFQMTSKALLRKRFDRIRWDRPLSFEKWLDEVDTVRKNGYAVDEGFFFRGITIIAVPVLRPDGSAMHFISAGAISEQLSPSNRQATINAVKSAAKELSKQLSF